MLDHPAYYIVLTIILVVLIVLLVRKIIQRRKEDKIFREYMAKMDELRKLKNETEANSKNQYRTYREKKEAERRAPANPQRETYYTTYNEREEKIIPKYAAGDDMDRINRHATIPDRIIPDKILYIATAIAVVLLLVNGKPLFSLRNDTTPIPKISQQIPVTENAQQTQKLNSSFVKQEWTKNGAELLITVKHENLSNAPCYNIASTYTLEDADGKVLQTVSAEQIPQINAYESIEQITKITLTIDPQLVKEISMRINYNT